MHIDGALAYLDKDGVERGRESFTLRRDGEVHTLRAFCEMDEQALTRDVSLAMDVQGMPTDGFVRVVRAGKPLGSTWFKVEPGVVVCEGELAGSGRLSQRFALTGAWSGPLVYLGLHPIVNDALITQVRGRDLPGAFRMVHGVTNSHAADGAEGLYAQASAIDVAYIGPEPVEVRAGAFAQAERYALRWRPEWPVADLWVLDAGIPLLLTWSLTGDRYELTSYNRRA